MFALFSSLRHWLSPSGSWWWRLGWAVRATPGSELRLEGKHALQLSTTGVFQPIKVGFAQTVLYLGILSHREYKNINDMFFLYSILTHDQKLGVI